MVSRPLSIMLLSSRRCFQHCFRIRHGIISNNQPSINMKGSSMCYNSIRTSLRSYVACTCRQVTHSTPCLNSSPSRSCHQNNPDNEDYANDNSIGQDSKLFNDAYLRPSFGHKVCVIQPVRPADQRSGSKRSCMQLLESCALVDSLPGWRVIDKESFPLKYIDGSHLFSKGVFSRVHEWLNSVDGATAVFLSISLLTPAQLSTLQKIWRLPVYDRFTIVLQIFHIRASTQEAKLQVALAEMPYYRSRLRGMHEGSLEQQKGGLSNIGGSGETYFERRQQLLSEKELRIRKKLELIRSRRDILRRERKKRDLPVVAIVGYTNAGKTSLIKALTGAESLEPRDQLFATLDVTSYTGFLANHMKVLFLDTIGFISDIPTSLVQSFRAVLDDIACADVIVHVADVNHPDWESQRALVVDTLQQMSLPQELMDHMVQVANKVDLVDSDVLTDGRIPEGWVSTSASTGLGLRLMQDQIESAIIQTTGRLQKRFKIPLSGTHLAWLHHEATVVRTSPCPSDTESLLVDVVLTKAAYGKFHAKYGKKKLDKT